jgi:hypothetical protein
MQLAELVRAEREAHVAAEALANSRDSRTGADTHAEAKSPLASDHNLAEMHAEHDGYAEMEHAKQHRHLLLRMHDEGQSFS